jgi:hypothetical protein
MEPTYAFNSGTTYIAAQCPAIPRIADDGAHRWLDSGHQWLVLTTPEHRLAGCCDIRSIQGG